jgi:exosortase/archaeosortase family protein
MRSYSEAAWVIASFLFLIFAFFFILSWGPIVDRIDIGAVLARITAWISYGVLRVVALIADFPLHKNGTIMGSGAFEVDVAPACSGAVPMSIYLSAVLAYPATWASRRTGVGLGIGVIFLVNVVRVTALFLIGLYFQQIFHETHVYVAQALVICVAVALWLYWATRFADAPAN